MRNTLTRRGFLGACAGAALAGAGAAPVVNVAPKIAPPAVTFKIAPPAVTLALPAGPWNIDLLVVDMYVRRHLEWLDLAIVNGHPELSPPAPTYEGVLSHAAAARDSQDPVRPGLG